MKEVPLITDGVQLEEWFHADPNVVARTIRADVYDQSLIIRRWPGNVPTVASLKETLPKTINRWWQIGREDDAAVCPIKTKPQTVLRNMFVYHAYHTQTQPVNKEQQVLTEAKVGGIEIQLYPSFFAHEGQNHFLILPKECWSRATTQMAGGPETLAGIIKLARETMREK
ncbi:MAG: hypothetical protein FJY98_00385 [Candidatus Liptonbacteria bacterium]|nr:hypothetical protein [Candidatus Liptonbacteria bacterium]